MNKGNTKRIEAVLRCFFEYFSKFDGFTTKKKLYVVATILVIMSAIFYMRANRFADVDSHIPATILAQKYGYDLEGYGLSSVSVKGIKDTYGNGTLRILNENIRPDSFGHYKSAIGTQGFLYAWLYQTFNLKSLKPLYALNAIFNTFALAVCAFLLGKIFDRLFCVIFFISLFASIVTKIAGSLYFSLAFWILPAIIVFTLYILLAKNNKFSKTMLALFCLAYMLTISLRASMSYEFITSIILFSLSPFLVSMVYALLSGTASNPPFLTIPLSKSFKYSLGLFVLACMGFMLTFIIHTYIRGGGDLWAGILDIYHHDFLRRMVGGNPKDFDPAYSNSLNANALDVIKIYLTGNLICLNILACFFICIIETNKTYRYFYISLILCFALPALSWFVLGKSHAYIHTHFCFVLWYLGFWASAFYVPLHYFYRKKIA